VKKTHKTRIKRQRIARGLATERILAALADEFPRVHDRDSLVNSTAMAHRFNKESGEELSAREKHIIRRTLGRLISKELVGEALFPKGGGDKTNLRNAGLVSVAINLDRLSQARKEWSRKHDAWQKDHENWLKEKIGPEPIEPLEPNQEGIVGELIDATHLWCLKQNSTSPPLIILGIYIVHGSSDFDLLMSILYRDHEEFLQYIRDIIQRTDYVQKTHTMQIGGWEGFPDIHRSSPRLSS
jgi:hypothetical protein